METDTSKTLNELRAAVVAARKQILDILELAFRDHPNWSYVRSRVLRALGKSGLEGVLDERKDPDSVLLDKEDGNA
jgi:hypothetical protein